jgi:hypothetical protein
MGGIVKRLTIMQSINQIFMDKLAFIIQYMQILFIQTKNNLFTYFMYFMS